jgi:hypothetical protein
VGVPIQQDLKGCGEAARDMSAAKWTLILLGSIPSREASMFTDELNGKENLEAPGVSIPEAVSVVKPPAGLHPAAAEILTPASSLLLPATIFV